MTSWGFIFGVIFVIFISAALHLQAAEILTTYVRVYNADISLQMRAAFLLGLQYAQMFLEPMLVLWNGVSYLVKLMGSDVLLPMLVDNKDHTLSLISSVASFARSESRNCFLGYASSTRGLLYR